MKKRIEHTIPLSKQVIELLNELKSYSGRSDYLFRGRSRSDTPISENTFGKALKLWAIKVNKHHMAFDISLVQHYVKKVFKRMGRICFSS